MHCGELHRLKTGKPFVVGSLRGLAARLTCEALGDVQQLFRLPPGPLPGASCLHEIQPPVGALQRKMAGCQWGRHSQTPDMAKAASLKLQASSMSILRRTSLQGDPDSAHRHILPPALSGTRQPHSRGHRLQKSCRCPIDFRCPRNRPSPSFML